MDDEVFDLPAIAMLRHLQAGRNKNLNRGFRKLVVWREDIRSQRSEDRDRSADFADLRRLKSKK